MFSPLTFGVVWDYYNLKLEGKQYKPAEHLTKKLKTEIKIIANPWLIGLWTTRQSWSLAGV